MSSAHSCVCSQAEAFLSDKREPIWRNLASKRTEVYRDIRSACACVRCHASYCCPFTLCVAGVFLGSSAELETSFGLAGPFWGRVYLFWHAGAPICTIYEVFSPALNRFIGSPDGSDASACK